MLCSVCRRQVLRSDPRCRACGTPLDAERHLDLVLPGGERVPIDRRLVIGRSGACELRLDDPSVSRIHAAIEPDDAGRPLLSDLGSSYGTHLEGRKVQEPALLEPGMTVTLGDTRFTVEERVDATAAGMTVSVPAGVSLLLKVPPELARERSPRHAARRAARADPMPGHEARRPRMRSGWSLKRGDASEGERRHLLKNQRSGAVLALAGPEAELVELLDGRHDLPTLIAASEERCGPDGISRLARLLAELADHDMLAGVEASEQTPGRLERLARPRELDWRWLPRGIASVYRRGGWLLFTRPAQALLALVALVGLVAFVSLIVGGGGTPLVVARRVGVGAAVFVAGRFALALCHEFAHGLCAESFGRPVTRAGVKIVLTFPYLFVDTTDAWFESRPRRIAIALAGRARCATCSSSSRSAATSARCSTSTRCWSATAITCSSTRCASRGCAGAPPAGWPTRWRASPPTRRRPARGGCWATASRRSCGRS
jgi:putative peptide zinc metalloprotease protein